MHQLSESMNVVGIGGTLRDGSTSLAALRHALRSAEHAGATTELLDLHELRLPMYVPDTELSDYDNNVARFIATARRADAMIWSTAGYHGSLAGVTKNAIDLLELLADDDRPYLHGRVVGLIATAGGELAAVNGINAMLHSVHALRGTAVPLFVAIPKANQVFGPQGTVIDPKWAARLDQLGKLVVDTAERFHPEIARAAGG